MKLKTSKHSYLLYIFKLTKYTRTNLLEKHITSKWSDILHDS